MARGRSIIVGGGIQSAAPFTAGFIPLITNADPPTESNSIMSQTGTVVTLAGSLRLGLTAADQLFFVEGDPSSGQSVIIGNNAGAAPTNLSVNGILIGFDYVVPASLFTCITMGSAHTFGATTNRRFMAIGDSIDLSGAGGAKCFMIGSGHSCLSGNGAICIGEAITISGAQSDIIALKAEAGLTTTTIGHSDVISIGGASSTAANQGLFGGGSIVINEFILGQGDAGGTLAARAYRFTNAAGMNTAVPDGSVIAPRSTGNALPGSLNFQVGQTGASGTALQTAVVGAAVRFSAVALDTYLMVFDVDNAALERVSVGAADSGGVGFKVLRIPN